MTGSNRVIRGGSWNNNAQNARSANRNNDDPGNRNNNIGFRLASSPHCLTERVHGRAPRALVVTRALVPRPGTGPKNEGVPAGSSGAGRDRHPRRGGLASVLFLGVATLLSALPAGADTAASAPYTLCPTVTSFTTSASSTTPGQPVTLTWATAGAVSASLDNGIGSVPSSGSRSVSPQTTTTYTLSVTNPRSTVTAKTTVTVVVSAGCAPTLSSPVAGSTVPAGVVTLEWQRANGATQYDVFLDTGGATQPLSSGVPDPGSGSVRTTAANLAAGATYSWKVQAKGNASCSAAAATSPVSTFRTQGACGAPGAFSLQSPSAGSVLSGTSTVLTWTAAPDAGSYDVYLGTANPPPLYQADLPGTATSLSVSSLSGGGTYYWFVVARAACDRARTTGTEARSFRTSGACSPPGVFQLSSPANAASQLPASLDLSWTASQSSGGYDVSLGTRTPPPLYQSAVTGTSLRVQGLRRGTYFWKVTARAACPEASPLDSSTYRFDVSGDCVAPPRVDFAFLPPGKVAAGESYVVIWRDAGLGPGAGYLVERSTDPGFAANVETQVVTGTSASFTTERRVTFHHRVRAVNACDERGPASDVRQVDVEEGKASVVFSKPPQAVIATVAAAGASLDQVVAAADPAGAARTVTIQNVSTQDVTAVVSSNTITPDLFFAVSNSDGSPLPPGGIRLAPGETRQLRVRFSSVRADVRASHEGVIYVFAAGQSIVPYTFVNLKLGATEGAVPEFRVNDAPSEYAFFPPFSGADDQGRAPLAVTIRNTGTAPMELGAEIGPEVWLQADAGWNAQPVAPGASATVTLRTKRSQAPAGSALPRYTYLTVRTKDGRTSRLLVQDGEAPNASQVPRSLLSAGDSSFVVPSIVSVGRFVTRLTLTNLGTEDVEAELFYTPAEKDGFSQDALRRRVKVPKHDVVSLTDPLAQLFGTTGSGQLEVRADPQRLPFLRVTSGVDAPEATGGAFGFQLPAVSRGAGATLGAPHVLAGITHNAAFRTNLILCETTGREETAVEISLYDRDGRLAGKQAYFVPRYGQTQINRIVERLGGGTDFAAGLMEISVKSGGGAVVGVITVIDNLNNDSAAYYSSPAEGTSPPGLAQRSMRRPLAGVGKRLAVVPSVVNGYKTFPSTNLPYSFASTLGLSSQTAQPATFTLRYRESVPPFRDLERSVTVPARATREYRNVLQDLFGIGPDSNGPLFIEADLNGSVYCKVYSTLDRGTLGDSFPIFDVPSERLSGELARRPLAIDGLEQSLDATRGTRSNLILNEVSGKPATVKVSLFEPGNRSRPIAEAVLELAAWEKKQLSSVFSDGAMGLNEEGVRQKERTNVLCVVEAVAGEGLVSATVTKIDNRTGDTRNEAAVPAGPETIGL